MRKDVIPRSAPVRKYRGLCVGVCLSLNKWCFRRWLKSDGNIANRDAPYYIFVSARRRTPACFIDLQALVFDFETGVAGDICHLFEPRLFIVQCTLLENTSMGNSYLNMLVFTSCSDACCVIEPTISIRSIQYLNIDDWRQFNTKGNIRMNWSDFDFTF